MEFETFLKHHIQAGKKMPPPNRIAPILLEILPGLNTVYQVLSLSGFVAMCAFWPNWMPVHSRAANMVYEIDNNIDSLTPDEYALLLSSIRDAMKEDLTKFLSGGMVNDYYAYDDSVVMRLNSKK